jgi:LPXTG-motif cell wall-anchored protein
MMHTTTSATNLWQPTPKILGLNQTLFYALVLSIAGIAAVLAITALLFVQRRKKL